MGRIGWVMVVVTACEGSAPDCTPLVDGDWVLEGAPFGTAVGAVLTMDPAACTFALDIGMGVGLPSAGAVSGDQLTLAGDDEAWASCLATVAADGGSAAGECDAGPFTMTLQEPATSTASR
ncbi:MAG: hypothetical protein R3F59_05265 [Myxococcota bacterium]